ncbi:bifunctional transcriptional activator/DNA repair enzyme AdaA [Jeotgalibacillus haloalkalitolerans]|uniref:Trifunctional transcriptional activator/DNA repair protein Ada/methylated-DNA--[protein]-cysteine S-methyltransferase n=1 Tax=Jeotgalibacillus haloalkalitolerans TaxID=3104292 RepID=A0ABU5KPD6_9BACL|nr:trifunctional transcriptional activator/DNA repair protein Ada/methylated-DNA--[protein]-cysteine S-methyltransferase [Jeotgalibacillus sp. HH7-29]MDZ5712591.1 trifunctional transcriptional activator/DNA repair protein Ada/methylated-DNA--[protein]-cysteine S-methyltransferase [Jeotgalibacillus sp. HH7-29]
MTDDKKQEFYKALLEKDSAYEGLFFVGVKSTGVFCRPTCPARKPKFENCEFYNTAEEALLASFRPCRRCSPLSHPNQVSELVQTLVQAVEENPEKKWREKDFRELAVDESTARRQFKKRFGMTFVQYARARRMGIAMKEIRAGKPMIDAQLSTGYESGSGFRDAFSRIMGDAPASAKDNQILKASWIDTRLGPMIAIADEDALLLLEFVDRRGLEKEVEVLRSKTRSAIIPGKTRPIESIERELDLYFKGELTEFHTPVRLIGTPFQLKVWDKLKQIPAGETRSYTDIACEIGKPTAVRAVARANGSNQLALIIPCHRVILSDGSTGGYAGGSARKKWLLELESKRHYQNQ